MIGALRFANAWVVWLTPPLLVLVGLTFVAMKRRQVFLSAFGELSLLSRVSRLGPERLRRLQPLFRSLALTAVVLALAGPVLRTSPGGDGRRPVEIVLVLDVSRSMGAEDYAPKMSRLGKARAMLREALPDLAGARVGIVTFAGAAFRQAPLTGDHAALNYILSNWVFVESAPPGGSDLAQGIGTAVRLLDRRQGERIVLLFSDGGQESSEDLRAILGAARSSAVRIFAFGLGGPVASNVPSYDTDGKFSGWMTVNGEIARTRLNEDILREIAAGTNGAYSRVVSGQELKRTLHGLRIPDSKSLPQSRELFQWPLAAALILLFLERVDGGLGAGWNSARGWMRRGRPGKEPRSGSRREGAFAESSAAGHPS